MSAGPDYQAMREAAEDAATRLRSILDDIAAAGILDQGAYGSKIESRITLTAERLDGCAKAFAHRAELADSFARRAERGA